MRMQSIVAEEIKDFDTSLDRLWARRDLVVVAAGALICFRSIYRRALQIGALERFRYAAMRAEDYVLGAAEEAIRDAVSDAAHLPGARTVVIYLSCLDILTRLDFADIEHTLSAETDCIVRCFFRGPLAKADGIRHETVEELLATLPPEDGVITASAQLPPPMSDTAGVSDFLQECARTYGHHVGAQQCLCAHPATRGLYLRDRGNRRRRDRSACSNRCIPHDTSPQLTGARVYGDGDHAGSTGGRGAWLPRMRITNGRFS